jgi:serine protease
MYKLHNIISKFLGSYTKPFSLLLCLLAPLAVYAGGDRMESPELFFGSANESNTFNKPSRSRAEINEMSNAVQQRSAEPAEKARLIVKFRPGTSQQKRVQIHAEMGVLLNHQLKVLNDFDIIELTSGQNADDVIRRYQQQYEISYAEPDMQVNTMSSPNDPSYSELWGLHNNMQTGGTVNADINAPEAWNLTTGSAAVVVAVIDTGVDYNHPDLAANMWVNPGEIAGDNIDNDGNGYVDDIYGIDTANNDSDPFDDAGHGTHVAGTIGAVGNNSLGIVGVNHQTSIIACKFLSASGGGSTSNAIKCLDYMLDLKKNRGVNFFFKNK